MSARIPDGSLTIQSEELQLSAARTTRKVQDAIARESALIKRVEALETELARIKARVDELEALGELIIDVPIPFDLAEVA